MLHRDIFAQAISHLDETTVWRAWAFRKAGVLVVREGEEDDLGPGVASFPSAFIDFPDEESSLVFELTAEQREVLGMSEAVYHDLNVGLRLDHEDFRRKTRRG